jgi:pilus assembly protein Flp/PilA
MISVFARYQAMMATRERGATAVEYGLMVALIAVAIIVAVTALGGKLTALFTSVTGKIVPAAGP